MTFSWLSSSHCTAHTEFQLYGDGFLPFFLESVDLCHTKLHSAMSLVFCTNIDDTKKDMK